MEYRMGKQLQRYRVLLYFVSAAIVYGFCYIYGYVFAILEINIPLGILLFGFTSFELVVIVLVNRAVKWYQKYFYYVFLSDRLVIHGRAGEKVYFWHEFQEARFDYSRIISMNYLPVIFSAKGQAIRLSKYVDGFNDLTLKILLQIQNVARVEEILRQKIEIELDQAN